MDCIGSTAKVQRPISSLLKDLKDLPLSGLTTADLYSGSTGIQKQTPPIQAGPL